MKQKMKHIMPFEQFLLGYRKKKSEQTKPEEKVELAFPIQSLELEYALRKVFKEYQFQFELDGNSLDCEDINIFLDSFEAKLLASSSEENSLWRIEASLRMVAFDDNCNLFVYPFSIIIYLNLSLLGDGSFFFSINLNGEDLMINQILNEQFNAKKTGKKLFIAKKSTKKHGK